MPGLMSEYMRTKINDNEIPVNGSIDFESFENLADTRPDQDGDQIIEEKERVQSRRFFRYIYDDDCKIKMLVSSWHHVKVGLTKNHEKSGWNENGAVQDQEGERDEKNNSADIKDYFLKTLKVIDIFEKTHSEIFVEAIKVSKMNEK